VLEDKEKHSPAGHTRAMVLWGTRPKLSQTVKRKWSPRWKIDLIVVGAIRLPNGFRRYAGPPRHVCIPSLPGKSDPVGNPLVLSRASNGRLQLARSVVNPSVFENPRPDHTIIKLFAGQFRLQRIRAVSRPTLALGLGT